MDSLIGAMPPDHQEVLDRLKQLEQRLREIEGHVDGDWVVYEVHEEGHDDWPFYIGVTNNVARRMEEHWNVRSSAIYPKLRAMAQEGRDAECSVLARFPSFREAQLYEAMQIALRPNLLNRDVVECRDRFLLPKKLWSWLASVHELMRKDDGRAREIDGERDMVEGDLYGPER